MYHVRHQVEESSLGSKGGFPEALDPRGFLAKSGRTQNERQIHVFGAVEMTKADERVSYERLYYFERDSFVLLDAGINDGHIIRTDSIYPTTLQVLIVHKIRN